LEERRQAYESATITVDTSDRTVEQVVDAILQSISASHLSLGAGRGYTASNG
jgi:hypothetical protein